MSKEEKYDRQLRLWQSQGQQSLEQSHVLIINPTIASIELLKNLVLPNVGAFTLLDFKTAINETDLSNNFFLNDNEIGKDKLEALTQNINELNWDVKGHFINIDSKFNSIEEFIGDQQDEFWNEFNLIVYNWNNDRLIDISQKLNIPLLIINSIGFYGTLRIYKNTFEVIETHPESLIDLRILYPWDELLQYSNSISLNSLDVETQSQIPYLIIQLKAVQYWLKINDNLPQTSKERADFKKIIANWKLDYNQLNFDEAILNSHKIFDKIKIPSNVEELFNIIEDQEQNINTNTEFWILVKALKKFTEFNDGLLPISGELPDMDSNTENYSILKKIYKDKFQKDLKLFNEILLDQTSSSSSLPYQIPIEKTSIFLKNCKHLFFAKNSIQKLNFKSFESNVLNDYNLTDFDGKYDLKPILLASIIIELFYNTTQEFPTSIDDLTSIISQIPKSITSQIPIPKLNDTLYELIRGENHELHNISSFLGGIGGQEAIKLITSQYVPLDNLLVFDGITSVIGKVKL